MIKHLLTLSTITFLLCSSLLAKAQLFKHIEYKIGLDGIQLNNGVAVADYDQDGDLDIFTVAMFKDTDYGANYSNLFRNNGDGTYTDVAEQAGFANLLMSDELDDSYDDFFGLAGYKFGAYFGDYDNDGYPDLFLSHHAKVHLFHNEQDGTFRDVTIEAGFLQRNECANSGATWFDFNNDGFLDLYMNDWRECEYNSFYLNNGDGSFTNVSEQFTHQGDINLESYVAFPFDFNEDGWMDLFVTNDFRHDNQLFINNSANSITDKAEEYGVNTAETDMGIGISDYDNDGDFDFLVTNIGNNFFFENDGSNHFSDVADDRGVGSTDWGWGLTFADFDIDGDEDLIIVNGFLETGGTPDVNTYYNNSWSSGQVGFEVIESGIEELTTSVEVIDFDYDHDGDLDVIITNSDRQTYFYENTTIATPAESNEFNWLKVSLQGTVSNRDAIGTTLVLNTSLGQFKRYYSGVGFLGQSLKPVHFGLPNNAIIESITVKWPSGIEETHTSISRNTTIKITENQGFELVAETLPVKEQGCTDSSSCNYNPFALVDDGSCEFLPSNYSIIGTTSSSYFAADTYSIPVNTSNTISWFVDGGEIIDGYGTNEITVRWHFNDNGKIRVVISDDDCSTEPVYKSVSLSFSENNQSVSIARIWNEALLFSIRNDFARPTVHARNLFHLSAAMYDAFAIYNQTNPYLIGHEIGQYQNEFAEFQVNENTIDVDLEETISYAAYRLLMSRFRNSPNLNATRTKLNHLMSELGYDRNFTSTDYSTGNPASLGNFIAESYIEFGYLDGSNEQNLYANEYYEPENLPLAPIVSGNPTISDPNRWQSLSLDTYIDQSGNVIEGSSIDFLSPEWGNVLPFAMEPSDAVVYNRNGGEYKVYHDPSAPPMLNTGDAAQTEAYQWGFSLVAIWSSHLDPNDGVIWDISPKSIGNLSIDEFPMNNHQFSEFYDLLDGGVTPQQGHTVNPSTGQPYREQLVPRGDYTRVLAEFWADGPDSETPPGHWFTILNMVNDTPELIKKWNGEGPNLSDLEWDIKSYFTLGGAMHDSAISAWSIKGWYDYIRPISAIRYMADMGQSSNPNLANYHPNGLPLIPNYIEIVEEGDALQGRDNENIGKIKLLAWKGHSYIGNPEIDQAGVGWILAEDWWSYQRPSFVTPPFAGYVSGHSTYSRAAAEVLSQITGSEFFPNGMGQFAARKNEFLVFEEGPSRDVILQWATYRDASDQCSLSRIWGGIHPPIDDVPGRLIGETVGQTAYATAIEYFKQVEEEQVPVTAESILYPNPIQADGVFYVTNTTEDTQFNLYNLKGEQQAIAQSFNSATNEMQLQISGIGAGLYLLISDSNHWKIVVE